jgi:hypothetical protein
LEEYGNAGGEPPEPLICCVNKMIHVTNKNCCACTLRENLYKFNGCELGAVTLSRLRLLYNAKVAASAITVPRRNIVKKLTCRLLRKPCEQTTMIREPSEPSRSDKPFNNRPNLFCARNSRRHTLTNNEITRELLNK